MSLLTDVRLRGQPLGFAFAFANAALFALYIVLGHRVRAARSGHRRPRRGDARGAVVVTPLAGRAALPALAVPVGARGRDRRGHLLVGDPVRVRPAGDGAPARATYALLVSLLPATAALVGVVVLGQVPTAAEAGGLVLVVAAVALHRERVGVENPRPQE